MSTDAVPDLKSFACDLEAVTVTRVRQFETPGILPADAVLLGRAPAGAATAWPATVLVLANKPAGYASVSRLVIEAPDTFFAEWPLWQARPVKPDAALTRMTLVVEDASPDSVWATSLLLARLAGVELDALSDKWLAAVEHWETDGMADVPNCEWPSLTAALGHANFPVGRQASDADYAAAWTDTLQFTAGCIHRDLDPIAIQPSRDWELWNRAEAALLQEEQAYHDWLPHALQVQLSLPVITGRRRMLVDALLVTEDQPTGAAKVFYRNDTKNAALGQGFTLSAHHRPSRRGIGNDITISLDTRRGVHLFELWEELERLECAAWENAGLQRPSWDPRQGLPNVTPQWNEPWYIDARRSLIGSPRDVALELGGELRAGSLLSWEDVKSAIWSVCNPLNGVTVVSPPRTDVVSLLDLAAVPTSQGHKRLLLADWLRSTSVNMVPARALSTAPVVERIAAALVDRADPRTQVTIGDLKTPGAWRRVDLSGGFAIVTEMGIFVLDDWRERPRLALSSLCDCFQRANRLDHDLLVIEKEHVCKLAREFAVWLDSGGRLVEPRGFVRDAASVAVRLAELRTSGLRVPHDNDARLLWEALDHQWAMERRLAALEQQTRTISDSVKLVGDERVRGIMRLAAVIALPYAFLRGLVLPLARAITPIISSAEKPPAWFEPACFAVAAILVWLALRRATPLIRRPKIRKQGSTKLGPSEPTLLVRDRRPRWR